MRRFSVRWKNFHGYVDTDWLTFKPVTIIIGSNNSGKSSLLLPLLMMKQTLDAQSTRPALVARGSTVNAGSFRDFVHRHDVNRRVSLCLRWDEDLPDAPVAEPDAVGAYPPGEIECEFAPEMDEYGELIRLQTYTLRDLYGRLMLRRKRTKNGSYSLGGPLGSTRHADDPASRLDERVRSNIQRSKPHSFFFHGSRDLSTAMRELREPPAHADSTDVTTEDELTEIDLSRYTSGYLAANDFAESHVHALLDRLDYLGPLRQPISRVVELSDDVPSSVGATGQGAPELLFRKADEEVRKSVDLWLKRFGLPGGVEFEPFGSSAFAMSVDLSGATNVADLGFGFSQLFPFLVQCILARPGDYIVATQPEIHLNPQLQAELAELLVDVNRSGAGIVLETHSEYLLTRLRSVIARGDIDPEEVAIFFVEGGTGESRVQLVDVDEYGDIDQSELPSEFFADGLREAIRLSDAKREAAKRNGSPK